MSSKYAPPLVSYEFPQEPLCHSEKEVTSKNEKEMTKKTLGEALSSLRRYDDHVNADLGSKDTSKADNIEQQSCSKGDEMEKLLRSVANSSDAAFLEDELNQFIFLILRVLF